MKNERLFRFDYGGKSVWEYGYKKENSEIGGSTVTEFLFEDGLKVTNIYREHKDFGAFEWVNYFENTGDKDTRLISNLIDCDFSFSIGKCGKRVPTAWVPDIKNATVVYAPAGSNLSIDEFSCDVEEYRDNDYKSMLLDGDKKHYSCIAGRSSEGNAPYFNIHCRGRGIIAAVGWTGQWNCDIERTENDVVINTGIEDAAFYMKPGEKFRASSILLMPYKGNVTDSQNKWRRLLKKDFCRLKEGDRLPFAAGIWGGMKSSEMMERTEFIKKNGIPFKYFWVDAGWYGTSAKDSPDEYEGDWWENAGDWRINPNIHPDGMKEVRKAVEEAGMKFLLWVEPERIMTKSPIYKEHPEYFISDGNPENKSLLLDLGGKDARKYCFDVLAGLIENLKINCYRQDFNVGNTLKYWRNNDTEGRNGITEIKYINGLYALWDALLEKFPGLLIDNCASGGRRLDIEMMKRGVPLWRSDVQCPANHVPEFAQTHNMSFSAWLPYSGTGAGREFDEYRVRSAYAGGMSTNWTFSARSRLENAEWIKKYAEEYLRIQPYFYGDVYPLSEISDKKDVWSAVQFDRPEENDGIVQVFVRERAPYTDAVYRLGNIDPEKKYSFEDMDGGFFEIDGKALKEKGLHLHIEEKRKAKLYIYKACRAE